MFIIVRLQRGGQSFIELHPVGKAGQNIMICKPIGLRLRCNLFADIRDRQQKPALRPLVKKPHINEDMMLIAVRCILPPDRPRRSRC